MPLINWRKVTLTEAMIKPGYVTPVREYAKPRKIIIR